MRLSDDFFTLEGGTLTLAGPVESANVIFVGEATDGEIGSFIMYDGGTIEGTVEMDFNANTSDRIEVFADTLDISAATLDLRLAEGTQPEAPFYILLEISGGAAITGTFGNVTGLPAGYSLDYRYEGGSLAFVSDSIPVGTAYESWLAGFQGIAPELAGPFADADGSGIANVLEFVLNGDPSNPAVNGLRAVWADAGTQGHPMRFTIAVPAGTSFQATTGGPQAAEVDGFVLRVEASGDLSNFGIEVLHLSTAVDVPESGLPSLESSDWEYHTFGIANSTGRAFMRLVIEE